MDSRKLIVGVIAALALLVAIFWFRAPAAFEEDYNARLDGKLIELKAEVAGAVKTASAQSDMFVSRDFPLFEIDNPAARQEYEQAGAALAAAEQGLVSPEASMNVSLEQFEQRVARAVRSEGEARQEVERLSVVLAEASYNRRKAESNPKAYTKDFIAQARVLEEEMREGLADAREEQERATQLRARAEEELRAVKEQHRLLSTPQGMEALRQYELETARERLQEAGTNMENLTVRAPLDGYVLDVLAEQGDQVTAGTLLARIVPLDAEFLWLTSFFDEKIAANLVIGQGCTVEFTALDGLRLKGSVRSIRPATLVLPLPDDEFSASFSNAANLVPVVISLDDYDPAEMPQLRLGMTARVTPE